MLDPRWTIFTAPEPTSCILALPGRSQHGTEVGCFWLDSELTNTMIVCITPENREWYPMPHSPEHQDNAVAGLEASRLVIEDVIAKIEIDWGISRRNIALSGFSAGGVMALYTAMHAEKELAGVACHGGAILEPDKVPVCQFPKMPIILTHCQDDVVFRWDERYEPMHQSLTTNNYNLYTLESTYGGHGMDADDVMYSAYTLSKRLGYSKAWQEERSNWGSV